MVALAAADHDRFSDRGWMGTWTAETVGSTVGATGEEGEPNHAGVSEPLASVWYHWQAPTVGRATADTCEDGFEGLTIAVYRLTYPALGVKSLIEVASGSGCSLSWDAVEEGYDIAIDGRGASEGDFRLRVRFTGALNFPLTVTKAGSGGGTVTSHPSGIDCGSDCSESYPFQTDVSLFATSDPGYAFAGWSGDCTGTSCTVTMDGERSVTATFVDITPPRNPILSSPSHKPQVWSTDRTVDVAFSGASDLSGVDGFSYLWDGAATTVPDTTKDAEESASHATSPSLPNGRQHYFHLRTVDNVGNWSNAVHLGPFWIDGIAPSPTAPVSHLTGVWAVGPSDVPIGTNWWATETASGIARYELQESRDGGAWTAVSLAFPTSTSIDRWASPGHSYQFRQRALDGAGNWSGWAYGETFKVLRHEETSSAITYSGTWARGYVSDGSGASSWVKYASVAGPRAKLTFSGRNVALVSDRAPNRGKADLYLDGRYVDTLDFYSPTVQLRRIVYSPSWPSSGTHTLELRPTGTKNASSTGTRVDLDAFVVIP